MPPRWQTVLLTHLIPLLLMTSFVEGYSLMHSGRKHDHFFFVKKFGLMEASAYETGQFLLTLMVVFSCTKLVQSMGDTFHGRHTFGQTFLAIAYGLSPLFLMRFFDAIPGLSPWITWALGIILSLAILYHGLPCIMRPDPPHAFGLYLISSFLLIIASGLVRFITAWYLAGKFENLEKLFSPG